MPEFVAGNIFIREPDKFLKKGHIVDNHAHNFDHVTYITHGSMLIEETDGLNGRVTKSVKKYAYELKNWVLMPKGTHHKLTALEDQTLYHCIFSHRRADTGEVVEQYTGWMEAIT